MSRKKLNCRACKRPWKTHPGPEAICKRLERARSALQIFRIWCQFGDLDANHVHDFCKRVLEETKY